MLSAAFGLNPTSPPVFMLPHGLRLMLTARRMVHVYVLPSLETRRTKKLAATGKNWLELFDTSVVGKCCFDGRNENGHRPHMREFQGKSF